MAAERSPVELRRGIESPRRSGSRLHEAGLAHGEVRDISSVLEHPQLRERQMIVRASSQVGDVPLIRFPLGRPGRLRRVPGLGEHTTEILTDLGYEPQVLQALAAAGGGQ